MQYLEVETPEGTRWVALVSERLSVGRYAHCDVSLPYAEVSRQHAELRRLAGVWWIRDLGSTNGLHIGAHRVQQHRFAPGDRVLLAPAVALRFVDDEDPPDSTIMAGQADDVQLPSAAESPVAVPLPPSESDPSAAPGWDERSAEVARPTLGPAPGAPPRGPLVAAGGARDHYRRTMPAQYSPVWPVTLHICQTCGQRTAPDVERCQSCHHPIARPCDVCRAAVLPIQDRCPRCQMPNPAYIGRVNRLPGG